LDRYGLAADMISDDWRVVLLKKEKWVVTPGLDLLGCAVAYKAKSIRDGERGQQYLWGRGGYLLLQGRDGMPMVIVGGEEKALAAHAAGYFVICPLSGEKPADEDLVRFLSEYAKHGVIFANDNDRAGRDANTASAKALEAADYLPEMIHVIEWPDTAAEKADLNDVLREGGVERVRAILKSAPALPYEGAVLHDLDSIFAIKWDPSDVILGDHVLTRGEASLWVGPPDVGKSGVVLQLLRDLILARARWLDTLDIYNRDGLRVLLLQTENSARRIQRDLSDQLRGVNAQERELVRQRLRMTVSDENLPDFSPAEILRSVRRFPADIVALDPFGDFALELESENDVMGMRRAAKAILKAIKTANPRAATIIVHHAKSGRSAAAGAIGWDAQAYGRGTKSLMSICRSQINIAPGDADGNSIVIACGKNNNGKKFEPFGIERDHDGVFQAIPNFDIETWKDQVNGRKGGRKRSVDTIHISTVIKAEREQMLSFGNLVKGIIKLTDCSEPTAKRAVKAATDEGVIIKANGVYQCAE
ncbi:AAA family ATPase, partial [bacterium]|nr:AAA family ATPase [bacterium]